MRLVVRKRGMHGKTRRSLSNADESVSGYFACRVNIPGRETSGERRTDFSTVGRMDDIRSSSVTEVSMKSWNAFWGEKVSLVLAKVAWAYSLMWGNWRFRHEDGAGVKCQDRSLRGR